MSSEQRGAFRLPGPFPARCNHVQASGALGSAFTATVLDLSATGAQLLTKEDLGFEREVFVEFRVGEAEIAADATIVRRVEQPGGRTYAVAFRGLSQADRASISRVVFGERRRRAAIDGAAA